MWHLHASLKVIPETRQFENLWSLLWNLSHICFSVSVPFSLPLTWSVTSKSSDMDVVTALRSSPLDNHRKMEPCISAVSLSSLSPEIIPKVTICFCWSIKHNKSFITCDTLVCINTVHIHMKSDYLYWYFQCSPGNALGVDFLPPVHTTIPFWFEITVS